MGLELFVHENRFYQRLDVAGLFVNPLKDLARPYMWTEFRYIVFTLMFKDFRHKFKANSLNAQLSFPLNYMYCKYLNAGYRLKYLI